MSDDKDEKPLSRIFLKCSRHDQTVAKRIVDRLDKRSIKIWLDTYESSLGDSVIQSIKQSISANDYVIFLLSWNSVNSSWMRHALANTPLSDLSKRNITLLPVRIDDCRVPPSLSNYQSLDLHGDFEKGLTLLAKAIDAVQDVKFERLTPQSFESLVKELLLRTGFREIESVDSSDPEVDLIADYWNYDPFGVERKETYVVEAKLYRDSRADLKSCKQLVEYVKRFSRIDKGLLVTNSKLTSAASEWLQNVKEREKIEVRVVDGTELKRLLLLYVDLIQEYFPPNEGVENE